MESPSYYPPPLHHSDSTRPTLGFPLGTALLLLVIFSLSGILSCCYHWDKLRHVRASFLGADDYDQSPSKPRNTFSEAKETEKQSFPVVMPGDRIARFIAMPCPCEPPRQETVVVEEVQKVQKPPHVALTLC
ncbi:hypothetical protein HanRHA438_Chr11g0483381 [Helianthus annuus]|uniref:Hydroxyproline-rich glycoprotein family protein n=1 Tax=Helianthus annuus TaxID=4232 RepID=A0A251T6X1_HELAN|nr:uncharacterized protein At5g65660 [Helianthus annuus]KAF5780241.1 hypothetical protein HanXRQr2_Chr11g0469731 [Helianthus annuus]KAJ0500085.1 hypothetical protein HanHA300_Chr11g0385781 [Helianthus annuus]KAJ0507428.1 hypothetical protein HanIR_Chr11g0506141 [Helianthus annuus]KAJ0515917.1 hypothetical protein HanHA89_Chr11g0408111 [Helianthus annuus]KAJ0683937.1 hypothetical protein HanLR1_Chr11g0385761 [Helianthus annuus]